MNEEIEHNVRLTMEFYDVAVENEQDETLRRLMRRDRAEVERLVRQRIAEHLGDERRRRLH